MERQFQEYLQNRITLSSKEEELISSLTTTKRLRRNQYLLQEEEICNFVAFVTSGCLRTYRVDEKGTEHIVYFAVEDHWAGDRESYNSGAPSNYAIDAVEHTEVVMFSKENFEHLCKTIPAFNDMINSILQKSFILSQNRIHAAISYSAEEKYLDLLNKNPKLINRLPQQMIASYLGITPETLSRIRAAILKKKAQ